VCVHAGVDRYLSTDKSQTWYTITQARIDE